MKTKKIKQGLDSEISGLSRDTHDNIEKVWTWRVNMNRNEGIRKPNSRKRVKGGSKLI